MVSTCKQEPHVGTALPRPSLHATNREPHPRISHTLEPLPDFQAQTLSTGQSSELQVASDCEAATAPGLSLVADPGSSVHQATWPAGASPE